MSFAKPNTKSNDQDEYNRLLCSVPGCGKIWTVKIDKPMCSFHQWQKPEKKNITDALKPKTPQWYDKDEF